MHIFMKLDEDLHKMLKIHVKKMDTTMNGYIEKLIHDDFGQPFTPPLRNRRGPYKKNKNKN